MFNVKGVFVKVYKSCKSFQVEVEEKGYKYLLSPKNRLTPAFCWGKGGLCVGELAYTILSDCCGHKTAEKYHTDFKWDIVASLPKKWTLTEKQIRDYIAKLKKTKARKDLHSWFGIIGKRRAF